MQPLYFHRMDISAPTLPIEHPDRLLDCEFGLEPAFQSVVVAAVAAGWTEEEVSAALVGLAANQAAGHFDSVGKNAEIETTRLMARAIDGQGQS